MPDNKPYLSTGEKLNEKRRVSKIKAQARRKPTDKQGKAYNYAPSHEVYIAEQLGAHLVPASGSKGVKGDVRWHGKLRVECKSTQKQSYAVNPTTFETLERDAVLAGENTVMSLHFLDEHGTPQSKLLVVNENVWLPILRRAVEAGWLS